MGAITLEDLREVRRVDDEFVARHLAQFERYLATQYLPIAGAEDDDDVDDDADSEGDGDGDGSGGSDDADHAAHGGDGSDGSGGSDADDDDDDDDDDDHVRVPKDEYHRMRKAAKDADKARRKSEREARERREKEQRDAGRWEEIVAERDERIEELEAERDEARSELTNTQRKHTVNAVAARHGAKDPDDVMKFLSDDEMESEQTAERGVKRVAREKPYLFEKRPATGAAHGGSNGASGASLTMEQVKNMSEEEINTRWDEVQKAMAAEGAQ